MICATGKLGEIDWIFVISSRARAILWIAAAVLLWPATSRAHPFQALRQKILAEVERGAVPAFAVAVLHEGRLVWAEGFGWVDGEVPLPVTADTPFSLASVSKPITATALMALVSRGEIDLDRPIDDYLGGPRLTGRGGDPSHATVRRVASHTAGLPVHFRFFAGEASRSSIEETVARYGFVVKPPGTAYVYSNLGYRLLERTLEVVTGESLAVVLRREVFIPLGMTGSALVTSEDDAAPHALRTGADGRPLPFYHSEHPGGSDIYASAHDLARFAALHLGTLLPGQSEILDRRTREQMRRPLTPRGGEPHDYGMGWIVEQDGSVVGHTGGMPGTRAALYLMPHRKLAVATLAACETDLPQRIGRQILRRYQWPDAAAAAGSRIATRSNAPRGRRPSRRLRGSWSGSVEVDGTAVPITLTIERGGSVRARLGSEVEKTLVAPRFSRRSLSAWTGGLELPGRDLPPCRYRMHFNLSLEGRRLRGTATAHGSDQSLLPFALGHWVELVPKAGQADR